MCLQYFGHFFLAKLKHHYRCRHPEGNGISRTPGDHHRDLSVVTAEGPAAEPLQRRQRSRPTGAAHRLRAVVVGVVGALGLTDEDEQEVVHTEGTECLRGSGGVLDAGVPESHDDDDRVGEWQQFQDLGRGAVGNDQLAQAARRRAGRDPDVVVVGPELEGAGREQRPPIRVDPTPRDATG